jgi:hypothetical protein
MPTVAEIEPIAAMLDHLTLGEAVSHGALTVIPLLTDKDDEPDWLTLLELGDFVTTTLRIDLTPTPSSNRNNSGMLQTPGDLVSDEPTVAGSSDVGLADLEDLLDSFAAVRPVAAAVSAGVLGRFLDDFTALASCRKVENVE